MKNFLITACFAVFSVFATSCYHSTVSELGDNLACFTKRIDKTTEVLGVKNTLNNVVMIEPCYQSITYLFETIVAEKDGFCELYSRFGERLFPELKIKNAMPDAGFWALETDEGIYLYFLGHELCGPYASYNYYAGIGLLFYSNGNGLYGAYDPILDEELIKPNYAQIIYAVDDENNGTFYFGNKNTFKKLVNGKEIALTFRQVAEMKKEAESYKSVWPAEGCTIVRVKTLR